jgi:hypothetical protein
MVKLCPNCGMQNLDDASVCMHCHITLRTHTDVPLPSKQTATEDSIDEFQGLQPRGYTVQPWQGRIYSKLGILLAGLYFLFFFVIPIFLILFVFSIFPIILGVVGYINGDKFVGKISIFLGIALFCITSILFISQQIV